MGSKEEKDRVQTCVLQAAQELGYSCMKPAHVEVILNFVRGRDVFAILPTGFGKSLCYACLQAAFDAINAENIGSMYFQHLSTLLPFTFPDGVRKLLVEQP